MCRFGLTNGQGLCITATLVQPCFATDASCSVSTTNLLRSFTERTNWAVRISPIHLHIVRCALLQEIVNARSQSVFQPFLRMHIKFSKIHFFTTQRDANIKPLFVYQLF